MKTCAYIFWVIVTVTVASWNTLGAAKYKLVSIYSLIAIPERYEKKCVEVRAYVATNNSSVVLSPNKDSIRYGIYENMILLDLSILSAKRKKEFLQTAPGRFGKITGVVEVGPFSLPGVTKCKIVPCKVKVTDYGLFEGKGIRKFPIRKIESEECAYGISPYTLVVDPGRYHKKKVVFVGVFAMFAADGWTVLYLNESSLEMIYLDLFSCLQEKGNEFKEIVRDRSRLEKWVVVIGEVDERLKRPKWWDPEFQIAPCSLRKWKLRQLRVLTK